MYLPYSSNGTASRYSQKVTANIIKQEVEQMNKTEFFSSFQHFISNYKRNKQVYTKKEMRKLISFNQKKSVNLSPVTTSSPTKPLRKLIVQDLMDSPQRVSSAAVENVSRELRTQESIYSNQNYSPMPMSHCKSMKNMKYDEGFMKYYKTELGFSLPKSDQKIRVRDPRRLPVIPQRKQELSESEKRLSQSQSLWLTQARGKSGQKSPEESTSPMSKLRHSVMDKLKIVKTQQKEKEKQIENQRLEKQRERENIKVKINEIICYREVVVIYSEFDSFNTIKMISVNIPKYVYKISISQLIQGKIFNIAPLREEMTGFLKLCSQKLNIKGLTVNFAFMINEEPFDYLCEIPDGCSILIMNSLNKCTFWKNVLAYHNLSRLKLWQYNFALHYINTRTTLPEISKFLLSKDSFQILVKEDSEIVRKQFATGLSQLKKVNYAVFSKFYEQICTACNIIEDDYDELDYVQLVNWEQEMQDNQYSKLVTKILDHLGQIQENKEEIIKSEKLNDLIKEFYQNETGASKEQRAHIAALLGKQIQQSLSPKAKLKVDNKELLFKNNQNSQRSFISENLKRLDEPQQKIKSNIIKHYPSLCEMNIPELQKKYTFSRKDLHSFYVKYKALVELNAQDTVKGEFPVENGIDLDTFRVGLIEKFASSSKNFLTTMFRSETIERMQWFQFLNIVNAVRSKKLEDRLTLFFSLMDRDGNGLLAYDEIYLICREAFSRLTTTKEEEYLVMMAKILANQAFELVGLKKTEEIPIKLLVSTILEKQNILKQEIALILLMCCTEKEDQDDEEQTEAIAEPLLILHPTWAVEGGEYALPSIEKKEIYTKQHQTETEINTQEVCEPHIPKSIKKEIEQLKRKRGKSMDIKQKPEQVVFSQELEDKLKRLVEEKRKLVHFEDDIVYEMEAKTMKSVRNDVAFMR